MTAATPAPALQIFNPESEPPIPTLRNIFEDILKPEMIANNRKPDTIDEVERAVDRWEAYWEANMDWQPAANKWSRRPSKNAGDSDDRITNPVLTTGVTVAHLEHWRTNGLGDLAPRTKNKHVGLIQQILNACKPHDIPASSCKARPLQQTQPVKYYITDEQICRMYPLADKLTWPRVDGISTGDWWRCVVALYWTYGFRLQDLFAVKASIKRPITGLQWSSITRKPLTPNPNGKALNELGWLSYTPSKTKRVKPLPLYLPITKVVDSALRRLEHCGMLGDVVKGPHNSDAFYDTWYSWQRRAHVRDRSGEPFQPYALRKSAATYLDLHWTGLADAVIGWSPRDAKKSKMATEVYASTEPMLITYLPTYALPSCFDEFLLA